MMLNRLINLFSLLGTMLWSRNIPYDLQCVLDHVCSKHDDYFAAFHLHIVRTKDCGGSGVT